MTGPPKMRLEWLQTALELTKNLKDRMAVQQAMKRNKTAMKKPKHDSFTRLRTSAIGPSKMTGKRG